MNKQSVRYYFNKGKPGKTKAFFICLLIAAFLWIVHALNVTYNYNIKIPVVFKNQPRNKKPLVQMPEQLSVDIKASGLRLALILFNRPFKPLEVDFNSLKTVNRNQNYVLSSSRLNFKSVFKFETKLVHVSPDTLYFTEKVGYQKNVPIKIPLYIKCQEGYGFKKPVITPSYLTIWGDTAMLDRVDTIYTQPLTLTNLNKSVTSRLDLIRPAAEVYSAINDVNIFIEVSRLVQQTVFVPVRDIREQEKARVNIFPGNVKITFTSLQNNFTQEDTVLFKAMIDSERINLQTKRCPVFLSTVPGNVTVMSIEPREVEIMIFKK